MDRTAMDRLIRNIDERLARVEQILPTLATKDELKTLATKKDLEALATKKELEALATKKDLETLATKAELTAAIAPLVTREEMHAAIREEGERTRRHFDVVAERMHDEVKLSLEGHQRLSERVDDLERTTSALDRRVGLLEAGTPRRKR